MLFTECFTLDQCWPKYKMDHTSYKRYTGLKSVFMTDKLWLPHALQGYLAHKKQPPPIGPP